MVERCLSPCCGWVCFNRERERVSVCVSERERFMFLVSLAPALKFLQGDFFQFLYSSGSIVSSYGLDDKGSRICVLVGAGNFSLHHHVQNSSGAHPASYPVCIRYSFPGDKMAGA